jgi:hypothetical protein
VGGPPAWGLGGGLTTPHRKKMIFVAKYVQGPRKLVGSCEYGDEPSGSGAMELVS